MDLISESRFEDVTISGITLKEDKLTSKQFNDTIFENCDFSSTVFESCSFINCKFKNCNLALIKIPRCDIENTSFLQCKMLGIDWTVVKWRPFNPKKKPKFKIYFKNCFLNYNIFIGLRIINAKFDECCLKDAYFENADLQGTNFTNSDLEGAVFSDTDLREADFSEAKNYNINAQINRVTKAKFSFPEAMSLVYALDIEVIS